MNVCHFFSMENIETVLESLKGLIRCVVFCDFGTMAMPQKFQKTTPDYPRNFWRSVLFLIPDMALLISHRGAVVDKSQVLKVPN
jgi:hypothetical protein